MHAIHRKTRIWEIVSQEKHSKILQEILLSIPLTFKGEIPSLWFFFQTFPQASPEDLFLPHPTKTRVPDPSTPRIIQSNNLEQWIWRVFMSGIRKKIVRNYNPEMTWKLNQKHPKHDILKLYKKQWILDDFFYGARNPCVTLASILKNPLWMEWFQDHLRLWKKPINLCLSRFRLSFFFFVIVLQGIVITPCYMISYI